MTDRLGINIKPRARNNREGEKRENPRVVRCGKCADLGDNYCKLNPSPVPCMANEELLGSIGAINISCISPATLSGIVVRQTELHYKKNDFSLVRCHINFL